MLDLQKRVPKQIATFVLCLILLLLFLRDSDVCFSEMKRGLSVCAEVLVPTLFPYMIISEILVRADLGSCVGKITKSPMSRLFGISGSGAGALLLGLICGFPIGAKTAAALYENGELSKNECERLLAFCNYPSAPFVIFAVGKNLLGSVGLGIFIYSTNVAAGLLFGLFIRPNVPQKFDTHIKAIEKNTRSLAGIFTDSVVSASASLISVCALVTFFTCAVGCLAGFDGINNRPLLKAVLFSLFELTSGTAACAVLPSRVLAAVLCGAAVGWSGLSVLMQIYSSCATRESAPSLVPYLKSKILSSLFCAAATAAAVTFFPALLPSELPDTDAFLGLYSFASPYIIAVDLLFIAAIPICAKNLTDGK